MPKIVVVGKFGRPHGVHGWIKVHSYTNPKANILNLAPWLLQKNSNWEPILIEATRFSSGTAFVKLKAYDSPETVKVLTNVEIAVERSVLPDLDSDNFYWADLIGLEVINQQQIKLGIVENLLETGANDVLVVRGARKRLIPYITQVIKKVNLQEKIIVVDWEEDY